LPVGTLKITTIVMNEARPVRTALYTGHTPYRFLGPSLDPNSASKSIRQNDLIVLISATLCGSLFALGWHAASARVTQRHAAATAVRSPRRVRSAGGFKRPPLSGASAPDAQIEVIGYGWPF